MATILAFKAKTSEAVEEPDGPHLSGEAFCIECNQEHVAVAPVGTIRMECPFCHTQKAVFKYPCEPDGPAWACGCGCQLFMISQKGIICYKCGDYQVGFNDYKKAKNNQGVYDGTPTLSSFSRHPNQK